VRGASRGRYPAVRRGAPVGAEPSPSAPLSPGMGPRALSRRARGLHARPAVGRRQRTTRSAASLRRSPRGWVVSSAAGDST
jgi:hypothetical protein